MLEVGQVYVNQPFPAVGIGSITQGGTILASITPTISAYDLSTAFGPVTDTAFIRSDLTFATSLGGFNLTSAGPATFTATAASVPEPGSLVLLGFGTFCLICTANRRRRQTKAAV